MGNHSIILELFGGICGFSKGLEDSGMKFSKIYYSEIDKTCIAVAKYNYGEKIETLGTVENVCGLGITKPNIITFGSPCQGFSQGGNNGGIGDERSGLILKAIEVVKHYRPDLFIWENVRGVITRKHREDFWAVVRAFANIGGYRLEWQLVDTRWILPQHRERIYLIGHLAGRSEPGVFPICQSSKRIIKGEATATSSATITGGGHSDGHHSEMTLLNIEGRINKSQDGKINNRDSICQTLNAGHYNVPKIFTRPHGYFKGSITDHCPTIKTESTEHNMFVSKDYLLRRLTEIECERLQGFPDDWTKFGDYDGAIKPIIKTARYRMLGNAVSTVMTREIGLGIQSLNHSLSGAEKSFNKKND